MKRTLLFLLLVFSSSALVIGIGCGKSTKDPIVAKVGDDEDHGFRRQQLL